MVETSRTMAKYSSFQSFLIIFFLCFSNMENGCCLLLHNHVNSTPVDHNSVSPDAAVIHQLLIKQMSYMENSVRLLTEEVSSLKKNRSYADDEISNLKQRLETTKQHNQELKQRLKTTEQQIAEMSQKLISIEDMCNWTNNISQNWNLQEERLNKLKIDVSNTVALTRTLAVNGEKDRNRTLIIENNVSVLKDELRNVHLFLVQASIKTEEINSSLELHINDSIMKIHEILDEHRGINITINNMVSDIRQGRLVSQNFVNSINKLESKVLDVSNHVGFTAGSTIRNSMAGSTLLFNKLIYSTGGGYDTSTGVFTSPVSGVFVFYVAVASQPDSDLYLDVMLNGAAKVRTMSWYPTGTHIYQTGTNVAVLNIQTGDRVWIKNHNNGKYYTQGDVPIVTFSGFRV